MEEEEEIKSNKLEEKDVEEPKSANEQNVKVYLPSSQELNLSQSKILLERLKEIDFFFENSFSP